MADADPSLPGPSTRPRGRPKGSKKSRPARKRKGGKSASKKESIATNAKKYKPPRSVLVPITAETMRFRNSYFTLGDIVSAVNDGNVYYAQIRGLLQDQYGEKSACLTWLLPTISSPPGRFDPDTFLIGPEEDYPRDLVDLEFVCHSPNEYYRCTHPDPFQQVIPRVPELGFARTSKGFRVVKLPAEEFNTDSE